MKSTGSSKAIVTGVAGYVGSAIANILWGLDYEIYGVDRRPPLQPEIFKDFEQVNLGSGPEFHEFSRWNFQFAQIFHAAGGASLHEVTGEPWSWASATKEIQDNLLSGIEVVNSFRDRVLPGGGITLISSINAFGGYGLPVYSSAKAGLHGLTRALSEELRARGVTLSCIALGTVDHPGVRKLHSSDADHFTEISKQFPDGKIPTAEIMAEAIVSSVFSSTPEDERVRIIDFGQTRHNRVPF